MLLEIQIFKTFIILYSIPSKGGKEISKSGKLTFVTTVILQQLFLIFIVQQTKAEVGSSYVSKTDIHFKYERGRVLKAPEVINILF